MKSNIAQFIKETNLAIKKEQLKQQSEARKIVLLAHSEIMWHSPWATGLFKGNNILTYNAKLANSRIKRLGKDDTSMPSEDMATLNTVKWENGDRIAIENTLVYADRIEQGWSSQQPDGTYGIVEQIMQKHLNKRIK